MLYIFVEGPDDRNFFEKVFGRKGEENQIIQYVGMTKDKVNSFIKSIEKMPDCNYLFFGDEDGKGIKKRSQELLEHYSELSQNKLYIVQYEIESWYYAGASQEVCKRLKIQHFEKDTNTLTKEQFNSKLFQRSERKVVMSEILSEYSIDLAKTRNRSFEKFYSKELEPAAV